MLPGESLMIGIVYSLCSLGRTRGGDGGLYHILLSCTTTIYYYHVLLPYTTIIYYELNALGLYVLWRAALLSLEHCWDYSKYSAIEPYRRVGRESYHMLGSTNCNGSVCIWGCCFFSKMLTLCSAMGHKGCSLILWRYCCRIVVWLYIVCSCDSGLLNDVFSLCSWCDGDLYMMGTCTMVMWYDGDVYMTVIAIPWWPWSKDDALTLAGLFL